MEKQTEDPNKPMYPDKFGDPMITDADPDSITRDMSTFKRDGAFKWLVLGVVIAALIFGFIIIKIVTSSVPDPATEPGTELVEELEEDRSTTTAQP